MVLGRVKIILFLMRMGTLKSMSAGIELRAVSMSAGIELRAVNLDLVASIVVAASLGISKCVFINRV